MYAWEGEVAIYLLKCDQVSSLVIQSEQKMHIITPLVHKPVITSVMTHGVSIYSYDRRYRL